MNLFRQIFFILSLIPLFLHAEEEFPQVWTYDDCIKWAKTHNINLKRLALQLEQSQQDTKSSTDKWLPSFEFSTTQAYSNYPNPSATQKPNAYNSTYGINASWTLWDGNIRKYEIESNRIIEQERQLAIQSAIDDIETTIFEAYLKILFYNEAIQIARETLKISVAQEKTATKLLQEGKISEIEYTQIETQRVEDVYSVVSAESDYTAAKNELKKILELKINDHIEIQKHTFDESIIYTPLPDIVNVYDFACAWNPLIKSNELNEKVLENNIKIANAGYLPKIDISAGIGTGYTTIDTQNWGTQISHAVNENIGLTLSIPIFDGNQTKRNISKAKLAYLDYEISDEELRNQLSQTIEQLYIDFRNAQVKYISGIKHVEVAELNVELIDEQFAQGLVKPIEMLDAHEDLLDAKLELLSNKFTAILCIKLINYYATRTITIP